MKSWITTSMIGSGVTTQDAIRPDLKDVAGLRGWVMAADRDGEALVLVARNKSALDEIKAQPGIRHHGDEQIDAGGRRVIPEVLQQELQAEARRLGASDDWNPGGYDVA